MVKSIECKAVSEEMLEQQIDKLKLFGDKDSEYYERLFVLTLELRQLRLSRLSWLLHGIV